MQFQLNLQVNSCTENTIHIIKHIFPELAVPSWRLGGERLLLLFLFCYLKEELLSFPSTITKLQVSSTGPSVRN